MEIHFAGLLLGLCTFLTIGIFHPIVVKTHYYFGTRPWWVFLLAGLAGATGALFIADLFWSALAGIVGFSSLWLSARSIPATGLHKTESSRSTHHPADREDCQYICNHSFEI